MCADFWGLKFIDIPMSVAQKCWGVGFSQKRSKPSESAGCEIHSMQLTSLGRFLASSPDLVLSCDDGQRC